MSTVRGCERHLRLERRDLGRARTELDGGARVPRLERRDALLLGGERGRVFGDQLRRDGGGLARLRGGGGLARQRL